MLISNKKYTYSKNEFISNWIDDLIFSNFFQHWSFSSKSHVNCDFFTFSLIISIFIYFSFSFFFSFSSWFSFFLTFTIASSTSIIICSNIYARTFETSLKMTFEKLHEKLHKKNFHELHACFIEKLNLRQKIHVMNTCDNQFFMQKMHNQNTRRRNFYLKRKNNVIVSAWNFIDFSTLSIRFDIFHIHNHRTFN